MYTSTSPKTFTHETFSTQDGGVIHIFTLNIKVKPLGTAFAVFGLSLKVKRADAVDQSKEVQ